MIRPGAQDTFSIWMLSPTTTTSLLPSPPAPAPPLAGATGGDSPPAGVTSLSPSSPRRRTKLAPGHAWGAVWDCGGGAGSAPICTGGSWIRAAAPGDAPCLLRRAVGWAWCRRSGRVADGSPVAAVAAGGARSSCWLSSLLGALLLRRFLGVLDGLPMGCGRFWWSGSRSGETRVGSGWPRRRRRPRAPISSWRRLSRSALPLPTT